MHAFWFSSLAFSISRNRWELQPNNSGCGSFPSGLGTLWANIQRRQTFCERIQSPA